MTESELMRRIQVALSKEGARLFRNNVGTAVAFDGRYIRYGVGGPGGSDLIGWTPSVIDGQRVAVFTAIEIKGARGRLSQKQEKFLAAVDQAGGLSGVACSVRDACSIILRGKK